MYNLYICLWNALKINIEIFLEIKKILIKQNLMFSFVYKVQATEINIRLLIGKINLFEKCNFYYNIVMQIENFSFNFFKKG